LKSLATALLCLSIAACGARTSLAPFGEDAGSSAPPGTDASSAIVTACGDEERAYCTLRNQCTGGASITYHYGTLEECVSRESAACVRDLGAPQNARGASNAEGCAAAYPSQSCTDYWDGNTPAACRALSGPRANGSACGVNSQCASTFCGAPSGSMCGTCQEPPLAGTPCQSGSQCWYNLSCPLVAPSIEGSCTPWVSVAGSCDDYNLCEGGFSCIGADAEAGIMGTCEPSISEMGASCNYSTGPGCDVRLYLYCESGTCQPEPMVTAGAGCDLNGSAYLPLCEAGGLCATSGAGTSGTCVAPANDGAPCDLDSIPCLPGAACVTTGGGTAGTCVFADPSSCG